MQATTSTLGEILGGQNQYIIPLFQRVYSWKRKNWEQLWEGVSELLDPETRQRHHFMGPLVFVRAVQDVLAPQIWVIDGQQRLTTLSLLLCALRNVAITQGFERLAEEIDDKYLLDRHHLDAEHLHILPRQRDRGDYVAAVLQRAFRGGMIGRALQYFTERVREFVGDDGEESLRLLLTIVLGRLEFVAITLDDENSYEIFRSLNATGIPLNEADLIRNFVFMRVVPKAQIAFDDRHWRPLEDAVGSERLTGFFRDFLMRDGQYISPKITFAEFEARYKGGAWTAEELAEELLSYAGYDRVLRGIDPAPATIAMPLARLQTLDSSTTRPLLLNLMNQVHNEGMSETELASAISMLSGFILRRVVCRETSRPYGRWFVTASSQLGNNPVENLRAFLLERRYPGDTRFRAEFLRFNLYGSAYAKPILQTFEEELAAGHREHADLSQTSLEHIMPQTLTPEWRAVLGSDSARIYDEWLHTPGNLTITGYNSHLGNRPFSEKRDRFADSNVEMNKELGRLDAWNEDAIRKRGEEMARIAVALWPGPADEPEASAEPVATQESERAGDSGSHANREALYSEYWETLFTRMREHGSRLPSLATPHGEQAEFDTGVPGVSLTVNIWSHGRVSGVGMGIGISGPRRYESFRTLLRQKEDLEDQLGRWLYWHGMPKSDTSTISLVMRSANPAARAGWSKQHAWIEQYSEALMRVFVPALSEIILGREHTTEQVV